MDLQLLNKIIKLTAPESTLSLNDEHPLLDQTCCRALAAGLVRLLHVSTATPKARSSLLRNIRSLTAPPAHHRPNNLVPILTEHFAKLATEQPEHVCDKNISEIDTFLSSQIENLRLDTALDVKKVHLVQALLNLDPENPYIKYELMRILVHNSNQSTTKKLLQHVWLTKVNCVDLIDRLSLQMKPEIEIVLLDASLNVISKRAQIPEYMESKPLKNLLEKSSISPVCFQICSRILCNIFIKSKYDSKIENFVKSFFDRVKTTSGNNFCSLLNNHLQSFALMLNCDEIMQSESSLVLSNIDKVNKLRDGNIEMFIMLMLLYPKWFDYLLKRFQT